MIEQLRDTLSGQYGGPLKMLQTAIKACPEEHWIENAGTTPYWQNAFHTLFFTDLYLGGVKKGFRPPDPFGLSEFSLDERLPESAYTKDEVLGYLKHCQDKVTTVIGGMNEQRATEHCSFPWLKCRFLELQFYNIRHIQHHVGQLNLVLRQKLDYKAPWVGRVD